MEAWEGLRGVWGKKEKKKQNTSLHGGYRDATLTSVEGLVFGNGGREKEKEGRGGERERCGAGGGGEEKQVPQSYRAGASKRQRGWEGGEGWGGESW